MKTVKKNPIMGERTEVKTKVTFVEWSRKKGFKYYFVSKAKNALEKGKEIINFTQKTLNNIVSG